MKFKKKIAIFAATALFACGGAAYTYDRYGVQDNSMVLANIEAMTSGRESGEGENGMYSYFFVGDRGQKEMSCMEWTAVGNPYKLMGQDYVNVKWKPTGYNEGWCTSAQCSAPAPSCKFCFHEDDYVTCSQQKSGTVVKYESKNIKAMPVE